MKWIAVLLMGLSVADCCHTSGSTDAEVLGIAERALKIEGFAKSRDCSVATRPLTWLVSCQDPHAFDAGTYLTIDRRSHRVLKIQGDR